MRHRNLFLYALLSITAACALPGQGGSGVDGDELDDDGNTQTGGSINSHGGGAEPTFDEGFVPFDGLGSCPASTASAPSTHYQPLTLMPCVDGTPRCEQLIWDGPVEWDPTGSGSLLEWEPQLALDAQGHVSHLLVMHRYPRDVRSGTYSAIPFEAVVYPLDGSAPAGAFRNRSDFEVPRPQCEIVPVLGGERLWMVGFTSGMHAVAVGNAPIGSASSLTALTPTSIDGSVLNGRKLASSRVLALESSDGRLYRVDTAGAVQDSFGPGMRVWLRGVVGDHVIASTDQVAPPLFTHVRFGADGFQTLLEGVGPLGTDGTRVAWLEKGATNTDWTLRQGSLDAAGSLVVDDAASVELPGIGTAVDVVLGDGRAAVVAEVGITKVLSATVIDLATKATLGNVPLPGWGRSEDHIVGLQGSHLWYGIGDGLGDGAYEDLVRIAYAP